MRWNRAAGKKCFKAIIDNKCPECKYGDLDLGTSGNGRWPLSWKKIRCPARSSLKMSTQVLLQLCAAFII